MNDKKLAEILKDYANDLLSFGIYVSLPFLAEDYLDRYILKEFNKKFGNEAKKWYNIAVDTTKDASVLQEEISLLKLAEKFSEAKFEKHVEDFRWMANPSYFENYYDANYYLKRIREHKKDAKQRIKELEDQRNKHKNEFKKLLDLIKNDKYLTAIVKTTNEAVFFRSYRTEIFYSSAQYFTGLFKEIAKRLKITDYKDILWLYWTEIVNPPKDYKDLIESRKEKYVFMTDFDGKFWKWDGKEADDTFKAFESSQKLKKEETKEVKGQAAYPGKITGKAVVVMSSNELNKVKDGEILVTHATNVNFVTALKKVSAIVTEEGGILSHAAIISREMRKPCIIGTKIATKVLKDGDLIEVNTNKGIVRILKRA